MKVNFELTEKQDITFRIGQPPIEGTTYLEAKITNINGDEIPVGMYYLETSVIDGDELFRFLDENQKYKVWIGKDRSLAEKV
jgi:hypothetical protein